MDYHLEHKSCTKIKHLFFLCRVARTDLFHRWTPESAKRKTEIKLQADTHPVVSILGLCQDDTASGVSTTRKSTLCYTVVKIRTNL